MDTAPKDSKPNVQVHCMQEDGRNDKHAKEEITPGLSNNRCWSCVCTRKWIMEYLLLALCLHALDYQITAAGVVFARAGCWRCVGTRWWIIKYPLLALCLHALAKAKLI